MRISVFHGSPHFKVKVLQVWQVEHPEDWDFYYEICADCSHIPRIIDLGNNVSTNNHLVNFEGVQESQLDRPPKP